MFQIMPALCPHGQGEGGGQPNVERPGQRGQKIPKFVRASFWMTPLSETIQA